VCMARKLKMLCVYAGEAWFDWVRIYEVPCYGLIFAPRYVVEYIGDENMWVFDDVKEALEFIAREFVVVDVDVGGPLRVAECPP